MTAKESLVAGGEYLLRETLRGCQQLTSALAIPLNRNGARVKVPTFDWIAQAHLGVHERWMGEFVRSLLEAKEGAFADVGANVGQTLIAVKGVAPDVTYVGFEPNPTCVHIASRIVETNRFANCLLVGIGLSNKEQLLELVLYRNTTDPAASLVPDFRPGLEVAARHRVPVFRLDTVRASLPLEKIAVLKIDVEGGELEVLSGARETLRATRPFVMCEILHAHDEASVPAQSRRAAETEKLLASLDYEMFHVRRTDSGVRLEPSAGIRIEAWKDSHRENCDYLAAPKELRRRLGSLLR
jgi:FkbM family methyltransferase